MSWTNRVLLTYYSYGLYYLFTKNYVAISTRIFTRKYIIIMTKKLFFQTYVQYVPFKKKIRKIYIFSNFLYSLFVLHFLKNNTWNILQLLHLVLFSAHTIKKGDHLLWTTPKTADSFSSTKQVPIFSLYMVTLINFHSITDNKLL